MLVSLPQIIEYSFFFFWPGRQYVPPPSARTWWSCTLSMGARPLSAGRSSSRRSTISLSCTCRGKPKVDSAFRLSEFFFLESGVFLFFISHKCAYVCSLLYTASGRAKLEIALEIRDGSIPYHRSVLDFVAPQVAPPASGLLHPCVHPMETKPTL